MTVDDVGIEISWESGKSDNIMKAYLTINNNSQHNIKNIEVICTHYDNNGSRVSDKYLIVSELIPSYGQKDTDIINMGFQQSEIEQTDCKVIDLEVM